MFLNAMKKAAKRLGISPAEMMRRHYYPFKTYEEWEKNFYKDYTPEEKKKHKEEVDLFKKRRKSMDEYYKQYGSSEALYSARPCILSKKDRRS